MHITMVKKRLSDGRPCDKCMQSEEMLRRRGHWDRIDEVVWAQEGDDSSPGAVLARQFGVQVAPFFLVAESAGDPAPSVVKSALKLVRDHFTEADGGASSSSAVDLEIDVHRAREELAGLDPSDILRWGLARFERQLAIHFGGAADVVLVDMAARIGLPFHVFTVDTGRLHPETYAVIDEVRHHYGIEIDVVFPDADRVAALVHEKGQQSFLRDGHQECCSIRRLEPLARKLRTVDAWATGLRGDQAPAHATAVPHLTREDALQGRRAPVYTLNPLARWDGARAWAYIHEHDVPFNALHRRGFQAIACEPCTRPIDPGQREVDALWWWEREGDATTPADPGGGI